MNKKALIISLNFNPGHLSHLLASYNQLKEIGYVPQLLVHKKFNQFEELKSYDVIHDIPEIKNYSALFFWFPAIQNLKIIFKSIFTQKKIKKIYVFHEPFESISTYRKAGFTFSKILRLLLILTVSYITCYFANLIILPSKKAVLLYKNSIAFRKINNKITKIPLIYLNENNHNFNYIEKKYFSYIGTVANDHAFNEFVKFICEANKNRIKINFLIATKTKLDSKFILDNLNYANVKLVYGKPLSNLEINKFFSSSILIWNAYYRTTQSGIMAKSFMFGVPVICLKKNRNEFTIEKNNTLFISTFNFNEILTCYNFAIKNQIALEKKCINSFQDNFYYRKYNNKLNNFLNL